ncbi:hypothetical protein FRX31_021211 [Thalictrum thalictroides]|uniref:Uncharacterized protein n=1 Tax=Thalictrum thalictroides TaxID=46969 RepID=A0A7J6VWI6_THATH|nr:hypothetical protein FRX31_021211 [Thalictrum thalictroides]
MAGIVSLQDNGFILKGLVSRTQPTCQTQRTAAIFKESAGSTVSDKNDRQRPHIDRPMTKKLEDTGLPMIGRCLMMLGRKRT